MAEIEKKWYVLRAISGKEAKVQEYLEADLKNSDLGEYVSQVLIDVYKRLVRMAATFSPQLFPAYLTS